MKRLPITLADGEHYISTPTFATLQLLEEAGIDLAGGVDTSKPSTINKMLAAMLTAEGALVNGAPERVWTPLEVGKLVNFDNLGAITDVLIDLVSDAFPKVEAKAESTKRPTRPSARGGKQ